MDKSGTDGAEFSRKVASRRRVAGAFRSLFNARDLQLESGSLHETLLVPVVTYGSETILWKEKDRSRIKAVQMNNLRGLLGIRRMDRVPNAQIRELYGVTKGVDKRIDKGGVRWFGHVERMEKDMLKESM